MPTYTRTLPNLNAATRHAAYQKLALLCTHIENLNTDLLSVSINTSTRVISVELTNPLSAEQRDHFGLD